MLWPLLIAATVQAAGPQRSAVPEVEQPNMVVVLADDQRWDTVDFMPFVAGTLRREGVVFTHAFVSNPVCCPARASLLAGGFYSRWTGVRTNVPPNGGVAAFRDERTIATALQQGGYATGLFGKYLNGYMSLARQTELNVPPGWTDFWGTDNPRDWHRWELVHGASSSAGRGRGELLTAEQYVTDFLRDRALEFIERSARERTRFFLLFTPPAPHIPATPASQPRDAEMLSGFLTGGNFVYRGRGWGERPDGDLSDKPWFVQQANARWWGGDPAYYDGEPFKDGHRTPDDLFAHQLQSTLAIDRAVAAMVDRLDDLHLLERTIVVYASDNGFLLGEHQSFGKGVAYEEAIRAPLVVWSSRRPHRYVDALVQVDLDLPVTILEYAGLTPFADADGLSLRGLLAGDQPGRERLHFEFFHGSERGLTGVLRPDWAAVRDRRWKYVEHGTLERELYDLNQDPYELENRAFDPGWQDVVADFSADLAAFRAATIQMPLDMFPQQRFELPPAVAGNPYSFTLPAWGGRTPYVWQIVDGDLPPGIALDADTGELHGTPAAPPASYVFTVELSDASTSPVHGGPQRHRRAFTLTVAGPGGGG